MKEIPLITSSLEQKLGQKKRKKLIFNESERRNENLMNCKVENVQKEKVKKIKIRLTDPNIPDSYICEVFDSSLEREEEEEKKIREESKNGLRGRDQSKQKNFFDVLMSKDSRRNFTVNSAVQNEEIPEETKLLREVESEEVLRNRKFVKAKHKQKLVELVKNKHRKINGNLSSTSDEDSVFEIQSSLRFFDSSSNGKNVPNSGAKAKNKENTAGSIPPRSSSGTNFSGPKPKGSNILSYFSKINTLTEKAPIKSKKANVRLKSRKLTDINMFERGRQEDEGDDIMRKPKNVKLAPLFQKKVKIVVDPEVEKARLDFLQNGLPTKMRKISNSLKNWEEDQVGVYFPDVSHVQQKDDDPLWCPEDVFIPYMKTEIDTGYCSRGKTFRFSIRHDVISHVTTIGNNKNESRSSFNSLQLRYKDVNIDSIFKNFKEKKDNYMKKIANFVKMDDSIEIVSDCDDGNGSYSLWTEIYRPKSDEIMGNKLTIARLSGWFKSWKDYSNEVKKISRKVKHVPLVSHDDSDVFISSDDDSTCLRSPVNICLLSGPIASGKTSLVYALAAEFDFNVLEVNSSCIRTGKKLLLNLEEATKSHQVSSGLNTMTVEERRNEMKTKRKLKKKKKKKRKMEDNSNKSNSCQMSVILIEDADIIFEEHDEGFVSAISTLLQSSKRPFIFLSNDPNYGYLERLKQQQTLLLEMRRPNFYNARAIIDVIALVEGVTIDEESLNNLIQGNHYDLRKSILELQFWVQSGKELIRKVGNASELGKLWWGLNKFLYKKDNVHIAKIDYKKRKRSNDFYDSSEEEGEGALKKAKLNAGLAKASKIMTAERKVDPSIHNYARILDSVLVSDLFKYGSDPEPIPLIESKPNDGLSLNECMETIDWKVNDLSGLIVEEIIRTSAKIFANRDGRNPNCLLSNPPWSEIRWRNVHKDVKEDLVSLVSPHGWNNRRNVHLDYLPIVRNICRAEKSRCIGNTKRKNRFYHYFRTLGYNPRDESLEISCDILSS